MAVADKVILLVALAVPIGVTAVAVPRMTEFSPTEGPALSQQTGPAGTVTSALSGATFRRPVQLEAAPPPTLAPPARPTDVPTAAPTAAPVTPTPTARMASGVASQAGAAQYTVQRGDELRYIAAQYGVSMGSILAANSIPDADNLRVGQVLTIPGGAPSGPASAPVDVAGARVYTVQAGDQLKDIAARYGVTMSALLAANNLPEPDNLRVGQTIAIPGG